MSRESTASHSSCSSASFPITGSTYFFIRYLLEMNSCRRSLHRQTQRGVGHTVRGGAGLAMGTYSGVSGEGLGSVRLASRTSFSKPLPITSAICSMGVVEG